MISLIICTRNRGDRLQKSLDTLKGLQAPDQGWELIIINNASTDQTAIVLERFKKDFTGNFTIVNESRKGASFARNSGWMAAKGDIIASTDDDCYPEPDFLRQIERCFNENPRTGFLGGRVLLYDPDDYPITIKTVMEAKKFEPFNYIGAGEVIGANLSFRREALVQVGGYNENFGPGTDFVAEDIEIAMRILYKGWEGLYDPRPVVWHHHGRKEEHEVAKLKKQYRLGNGAYLAKAFLTPNARSVYVKRYFKHTVYRLIKKREFQYHVLYGGFKYIYNRIFRF